MPALVTCKGRGMLEKTWNVGSDDFVVPSFLSVVVGVCCVILVLALLLGFYITSSCDGNSLPPILYNSFFVLLAIQVAIAIDQTIIMSISSRGTILNTKPRRSVEYYLYARIGLFVAETFALVVCTIAVGNSAITNQLLCATFKPHLRFAQGVVIALWLIQLGVALKALIYIDPLGLFAPGLLPNLTFLDTSDDVGKLPSPFHAEEGEPKSMGNNFKLQNPGTASTQPIPARFQSSHSVPYMSRERRKSTFLRLEQSQSRIYQTHLGQRRVQRRLKAICCCLGIGGHRSRGIALIDAARALQTLFDFGDTNLVLSDVFAGLILFKKYQRERKSRGESLVDRFRKVTFEAIPSVQIPLGYEYKAPEEVDFSKVENWLLFDNLIHYMQFAVGIYGWPLHVFMNPCCGLCQLSTVTCCACNYRCCNSRRARQYVKEDCCMCGVGTIRLQTGISEKDILFVSYDNEIYKAPFSVCMDHKTRSVVITVRGSLSFKDALTDMFFSLRPISVEGCWQAYVHGGMYMAASQIRKELERNKVLETTFNQYQNYQLVVTGHSLGAGVASVLALLLRPQYPDLVCYAFSPPGCVFSFPLAVYSQDFITSVVLGNDFVPRISFRALLHLKFSLQHLITKCKQPKYQVMLQSRWCDWLLRRKLDKDLVANLRDIEQQVVSKKTFTQMGLKQALFAATATAVGRQSSALTSSVAPTPAVIGAAKEHCRAEDSDHFMPTFPPGRVLHIEVEENAKVCCLGWCYPNQMKVSRVANEDLCVIRIDKGAIQDHLPNEVLSALKRCKKQLVERDPEYKPEKITELQKQKAVERERKQKARMKTEPGGQFFFPVVTPDSQPSTPLNAERPTRTSVILNRVEVLSTVVEQPHVHSPREDDRHEDLLSAYEENAETADQVNASANLQQQTDESDGIITSTTCNIDRPCLFLPLRGLSEPALQMDRGSQTNTRAVYYRRCLTLPLCELDEQPVLNTKRQRPLH